MWTKEQLWDFLMLVGSIAFLAVTVGLTFHYGVTILLTNAPVGLAGLFLHVMFRRMLAASRAQAEQAQRHLKEMSSSVAEQEKISRELEKSEEKFRNAFDHAAVGMALVAPVGQILKVNQSFCEIVGYTKEEVLKLNFQTLLHKEDLYSFNVGLAKLFESGQGKTQTEERIKHKEGHLLWLLRDTSLAMAADDDADSAHFIFQLQNITDRKRAEERLNHDAFHDALTDLPNRALFTDRLRTAFISARRHPNNQFAVLFVDIDRFKRINESYGHHFGDELMMCAARRLESILRSSDTAARLGGDDFVLIVGEVTNAQEAREVAENLQKVLSEPFNFNGQEIVLTFSIGIALWSRDAEDHELLLRDAETALSQAKKLGRGRIEVFDAATNQREQQSFQLEMDLRKAVERNEFLLHFQPVVNLDSNKLVGMEALIRWQHPTRGLLSPAEFISVCEELGLIDAVGLWVVREACSQLRLWHEYDHTADNLWVSVNVSGKQFRQTDLVAQIAGVLEESQLPPQFLKLELTESAVMENLEQAIETMKELKELGVRLSIDDFGKGYSSLNHLAKLPVDYLKIDGSFVKDMHVSEENREIVKTIISLAQSLSLEVIAEGIENRQHISNLRDLGCYYGQGYYFAKPYNAAAIEQLLKKQRRRHEQSSTANQSLKQSEITQQAASAQQI